MSIAEQLQKVVTTRNAIRTKLVQFGIVSADANLVTCATAVEGMTNNTGKTTTATAITGELAGGANETIYAKPKEGYCSEKTIVKVPVPNLLPENIKAGVNVAGVTGVMNKLVGYRQSKFVSTQHGILVHNGTSETPTAAELNQPVSVSLPAGNVYEVYFGYGSNISSNDYRGPAEYSVKVAFDINEVILGDVNSCQISYGRCVGNTAGTAISASQQSGVTVKNGVITIKGLRCTLQSNNYASLSDVIINLNTKQVTVNRGCVSTLVGSLYRHTGFRIDVNYFT